MTRRAFPVIVTVVLSLAAVGGIALAAQDKYTVQVPDGLAFSEFKGYESWEVVSASLSGEVMAVITANPVMIEAFKAGIPGNGKAFPDGSKMAKIHYNTKKLELFPTATVPGKQLDADFMVKDSKRFPDGGGWGYAVFRYDAAADTFRPGTASEAPPQNDDAKCGVACHNIAKSKDFVFSDYARR